MVLGYLAVTPENPTPAILSIPFEHQLTVFIGLMVAGEVLTILGLILLGGLWWERFRQLFVWPGAGSMDETPVDP